MTDLSLIALRAANKARQLEWTGGDKVGLLFRAVELAGETGEALNLIKKLEREARGWRGSRTSIVELAEELADIVIVADLLAAEAGIDLAAAVRWKFDKTSEKNRLQTRLGSGTGGTGP